MVERERERERGGERGDLFVVAKAVGGGGVKFTIDKHHNIQYDTREKKMTKIFFIIFHACMHVTTAGADPIRLGSRLTSDLCAFTRERTRRDGR